MSTFDFLKVKVTFRNLFSTVEENRRFIAQLFEHDSCQTKRIDDLDIDHPRCGANLIPRLPGVNRFHDLNVLVSNLTDRVRELEKRL